MKTKRISICEVFRTVRGHSKLLAFIICCHCKSGPSALLGTGDITVGKHYEDTGNNGVIFTILVFKA